jgi:serine/threonine protein kinase
MAVIENKSRGVHFDTATVSPVGQGGEGEIYIIAKDLAAKVYLIHQLNRIRQEKVLALCSKYAFFEGLFDRKSFAFPQLALASQSKREIVGFAMSYFGKLPQVDCLKFDLNAYAYMTICSQALDDTSALALVYKLFESLEALHRARVILGDVNPRNILYDWSLKSPVFVDLDAAHIERYGCVSYSQEYIDPQVEAMGTSVDGTLKYTCGGDRFAMAVVAYELLVGVNPFFLRCKPAHGVPDNKRRRISLLACTGGLPSIEAEHISDYPINGRILKRLAELRRLDPVLCDYFRDIFLGGSRESLLNRLPTTDPRNPAHTFHLERPIRTIMDVLGEARERAKPAVPSGSVFTDADMLAIAMTTMRYAFQQEAAHANDPPLFKRFVENLDLDYGRIVARGSANS